MAVPLYSWSPEIWVSRLHRLSPVNATGFAKEPLVVPGVGAAVWVLDSSWPKASVVVHRG